MLMQMGGVCIISQGCRAPLAETLDKVVHARQDCRMTDASAEAAAAAAHPFYYFLKDFQPTLAALVALLVAVIAYRGAMAKVKFDREIDSRTQRGISPALALRLEAQLTAILAPAAAIATHLTRVVPPEGASLSWQRHFYWDFDLSALDEAWQQLDRIPAPAIHDVASMRATDQVINTIDHHSRTDGTASRVSALRYIAGIRTFTGCAQRLLGILRSEINRLHES